MTLESCRRRESLKKINEQNTMQVPQFLGIIPMLFFLSLPACDKPKEQVHHEHHKILVTSPLAKDITTTQQFVSRIHSYRHIEVRAMESGYLEAIQVKEGQLVKEGDSLFKVVTTLYQARLDAEVAEAKQAQIEYDNTKKLFEQKVVAQPEVALFQAKLTKAQAKVKLSQAELNFADIKAPFDGIIDQQRYQQGSLIAEGDVLTTLSDNSVMWVYFNLPEKDYLKYQASTDKENIKVELMLANGEKFPQIGKIAAIEADFNNENGNIAFRADFPNPDRILRHGQTGTILLSRVVKDAVVIPQRATFEILAKRYAFVVTTDTDVEKHIDADDEKHDSTTNDSHGDEQKDAHGEKPRLERGVAQQREIIILKEMDDIYIIKDGIGVNDRIVLEGIRQVRDGEEVEYEFRSPEEVLGHLKFHAE